MRLSLPVGRDFSFLPAACSYGYFMLAPNRWEPRTRALMTAFHLDEANAVDCRIRARNADRIEVELPGVQSLSDARKQRVRQTVARIFRLDEDLTPFHRKCRSIPSHANAARIKFGRLIRSATLFEDIIKTICSMNITWRQTVHMVSALASHFGTTALNAPHVQAFPSPARLAVVSVNTLKTRCKLGYRADFVQRLARDLLDEQILPAKLEDPDLPTDDLYQQLRAIRGIGDYGASNLCMLLGRYDRLAVDTELVRHYKAHYPRRDPSPRLIRKHYARHHPYQFLAYWYELWNDYATRHGPAEAWTAEDMAERITE